MNSNKTLAGLLAVLAGTLGGHAVADDYHYTNILIGDRASGMAGAYTAVSDDPAGLYYNPAGIAYARTSSISASVNAYHMTSTTYKNALGSTYDWNRTSSSLLPNFFGIVQPIGNGVFGFSYAVPDSMVEDQDQTFRDFPSNLPGIDVTRYTVNFNRNDSTYKFGPSYAQDINDKLSWGLTLYYHYRTAQMIQNQYIILSDGRREWTNNYSQSTEHGIQPILGLMWSATDRLALGATLTKTQILGSSTTGQLTAENILNQSIPPIYIKHDDQRTFPTQLRLGAAYFASERLLLSADLMHNTAYDYELAGLKIERDAVTDLALGAEYYLTGTWALRGGLYTSYSNTPDIDGNHINQEEHIDIVGLTGSISRYTRASSLTLGMGYGMGSGRAQLFAGTTNYQDVDYNSFTVFLSTSYSF